MIPNWTQILDTKLPFNSCPESNFLPKKMTNLVQFLFGIHQVGYPQKKYFFKLSTSLPNTDLFKKMHISENPIKSRGPKNRQFRPIPRKFRVRPPAFLTRSKYCLIHTPLNTSLWLWIADLVFSSKCAL